MTDAENKFTMLVGKWRFVVNAWHGSPVEVISEEPSPLTDLEKKEPADPFAGLTSFGGVPEEKNDPVYVPFHQANFYHDEPFGDDDDDEYGGKQEGDGQAEEAHRPNRAPGGINEQAVHRILDTIYDMQRDFDNRIHQSKAQIEAYHKQARAAEERSAEVYDSTLQTLHTKNRQLEARIAQSVPGGEQAAMLDRLSFNLYNQQGSLTALKNHFVRS